MAENLAALVPRHIDIQKDQIRARCSRVRVSVIDESYGLLAVVDLVQLRQNPRARKSLTDQSGIGLVVLDDEDSPPPRPLIVRRGL